LEESGVFNVELPSIEERVKQASLFRSLFGFKKLPFHPFLSAGEHDVIRLRSHGRSVVRNRPRTRRAAFEQKGRGIFMQPLRRAETGINAVSGEAAIFENV